MSRLLGLFSRLQLGSAAAPAVHSRNGTVAAPSTGRELVPTSWWTGNRPVRTFPDALTDETWDVRARYREMLRDPYVKVSILKKVWGTAQLNVRVKPAVPDNPRSREVADFNLYNLENAKGGIRAIVESILFGALVDGYGVCHKKRKPAPEDRELWPGKWCLEALKPKDSEFFELLVNEFREVTGIRPLVVPPDMPVEQLDRDGRPFPLDPSLFVIVRHLSIFDAPQGMSDLRAADRAYCCLDTLLKMREQYRELFGLGPFLWAEGVPPADQKKVIEQLVKARGAGVAATAPNQVLKIATLAVGPEAEFQAACREFKEEIATAITGAYLHMMAGGPDQQRGSSAEAGKTVEDFVWYLAELVSGAANDQVIPEYTDLNFAGRPAFPKCQLVGVNPDWQSKVLNNGLLVKQAGVDTSAEQWREESGWRAPKEDDPADVVPGGVAPVGGPPGQVGPDGQPLNLFDVQAVDGKPVKDQQAAGSPAA